MVVVEILWKPSTRPMKDELKNLVRLHMKKNVDEAVYTEEHQRVSKDIEEVREQKKRLEEAENLRIGLKDRMDEIIQILCERQALLKEFDDELFDVLVQRVVVVSPQHFKFELKSGIVIEHHF
jgi:site-specific DNA recombinase